MIDPSRDLAQRRRNRLETLLLMGAAVLILAVAAVGLAGPLGLVAVPLVVVAIAYDASHQDGREALTRLRARALSPQAVPGLCELVETLSARAGLSTIPALYLVPQKAMNAFAIGSGRHAAIGVTPALLTHLTRREVAGVLAHEIGHLAHGDLRVFATGERMQRLAGVLSIAGLALLVVNLPALMSGRPLVPILPNLLMLAAPGIIMSLRLALSRTREFDADRMAAQLTGDPQGLADALQRVEAMHHALLARMFPGLRRTPGGVQATTHPPMRARLARLGDLKRPGSENGPVGAEPVVADGHRPFVLPEPARQRGEAVRL
ncbi:MAG: M48 family metalloprotease [Hyphomicrobiaceae bacterium]|nr:M48 family metalloprotease [Hyphomicrobiaceae bacterium]